MSFIFPLDFLLFDKTNISQQVKQCLWLIFKLQLFRSIATETGYIILILGPLIRVSFSSTFFSNLRPCQQLRSFHRALSTIWSVYFTRWNDLHLTFSVDYRILLSMLCWQLFTVVSNKIPSALSDSIIIFSGAACPLLLLYINLMLEPGFFGNNIIKVSFLHLLLS